MLHSDGTAKKRPLIEQDTSLAGKLVVESEQKGVCVYYLVIRNTAAEGNHKYCFVLASDPKNKSKVAESEMACSACAMGSAGNGGGNSLQSVVLHLHTRTFHWCNLSFAEVCL